MLVIRELSLRKISGQLGSHRRAFNLLIPPALSSVLTPIPSLRYLHSMASAADHAPDPHRKGPPAEPRPSSSVLLISPQNQILLLQRVIRERDHFGGRPCLSWGQRCWQTRMAQCLLLASQAVMRIRMSTGLLRAERRLKNPGFCWQGKKKGKGLLQISEAEREIARHKM